METAGYRQTQMRMAGKPLKMTAFGNSIARELISEVRVELYNDTKNHGYRTGCYLVSAQLYTWHDSIRNTVKGLVKV